MSAEAWKFLVRRMLSRVRSPGNGYRMIPAYRVLLVVPNATVMSAVAEPSATVLGTIELRVQVLPPSMDT